MIFEPDILKEDFLEIVLTESEYEDLYEFGIVKDWAYGLFGKRDLNTYIRVEKQQRTFKMPLKKGAEARTKKGFSENVKTEMKAGKGQKQAVAIAYSEAGEKKKAKKKVTKGKK